MALTDLRIQPQYEVCCVCWEVLDVEQDYRAEIVPITDPEVNYFHTDQECEGCAFGIK